MTTIPTRRIPFAEATARPLAALLRLEGAIELDPRVRELVKMRASQLNGCAYCLDMHWKDARAAGESAERLYMLDAWRESPLYDDRERAALALCEAMTRLPADGIPDDVVEEARAHFADDELAHLLFAIAAINTWNRLNVTAGTEPGHYDPSMRAAAA